jgi:DEAD/DEAH box helicase domain-containing protein
VAADALSTFYPAVHLYDNVPGGVGLSEPLFGLRNDVVAGALSLVAGCDCAAGCPACIGPILASDEAGARSPKAHALAVLDLLAGAEPALAAARLPAPQAEVV